MAGECMCGAWQEDLPTVRGDLREAVQMLAGDNARLCTIVIAADKLAEVFERYQNGRAAIFHVEQALHAYKIARQGQ